MVYGKKKRNGDEAAPWLSHSFVILSFTSVLPILKWQNWNLKKSHDAILFYELIPKCFKVDFC